MRYMLYISSIMNSALQLNPDNPCAACRLATCKFTNLEKKLMAPPPLLKSWGRPCYTTGDNKYCYMQFVLYINTRDFRVTTHDKRY